MTIEEGTNTFAPDYAAPPGWLLEEYLEVQDLSHAEFARRCGRSPKLISEIISGKAPVEPGTAIQFEKVLGLDASVWLGMEADYRLHMAREAEEAELERGVKWYRALPVKELIERGMFTKPASEAEGVGKALAFFGVASIGAWHKRYGAANVAYRHSPSFKSTNEAIATWLRLGELAAARQECADYDEARFRASLRDIRGLTTESPEVFVPATTESCNAAGVAFVVVKGLKKTALSGAARWLSPRKALIQLSLRYKSDDQLWFSFFHEAAHLLLHSKKEVFVDGKEGDGSKIEEEANKWAANFLVPPKHWQAFVASAPRSKAEVIAFARKLDIAPGIVVGKMHHEKLIPWNQLQGLKRRYKWKDD